MTIYQWIKCAAKCFSNSDYYCLVGRLWTFLSVLRKKIAVWTVLIHNFVQHFVTPRMLTRIWFTLSFPNIALNSQFFLSVQISSNFHCKICTPTCCRCNKNVQLVYPLTSKRLFKLYLCLRHAIFFVKLVKYFTFNDPSLEIFTLQAYIC